MATLGNTTATSLTVLNDIKGKTLYENGTTLANLYAAKSHNHDTVYAKKSDFSAYDSVKAITAANITSWNGKGTYSKPSGGIPDSDLASTFLKSVPTASSSTLGGIKIASPFTIDNGVLKINTFGGYNAPGVVNCSEDVDDKVLMSDGAWRNIASNYIKPAISKQYRSTGFYGSANNYNGASWFFMYVRPNSWQSTWTVKFKIRSTVTGQPTYDSTTYSTISGCGGTIAYHNWNIRNTGAYCHYYIASERLKEAGYNAGHAHAFGISLYNASNATSSSYPRNFDFDYYECDNCTVTILDTPVKYDGVAGYSTSNFESVTGYNAVDNGLQEFGDANTINQQYIQGYGFAGSVNVNYGLWGRGRDDKILAVSGVGVTYTTTSYPSKGVPTTWSTSKAYAVGNPIYYATNGGFYQCIKAHTSSSSILPTNTTYWSAYRWYNSDGFDWHHPIVWNSNSGTYAPGANCNGITGYINYGSVDFRYCDNAVAYNSSSNTLGISVREPVFLKGYMKDGLFYLKPETVTYSNNTYYRVWTQTIPTSAETYTESGKTYPVVYWQIGHGHYSSSSFTIKEYRVAITFAQPMYWYHNGAFRIYEEGLSQSDFVDFPIVSAISGEETGNWDTAYTNSHTHSNKSVIDGITAANITSWNGKGTYSKPSGGIPSTDVAFNYAGSSSKGGAASSVAQALTFSNGGSGAASGTTYNGSTARTISYNSIGAAASSHTHAQTDITGLSTSLAAKLDKSEAEDTYAVIDHNHSASNITSGTLAVARGGTGKTTGADAANYFLNELSVGTSTPKDADYFISQYANGGTTTTTYHRRSVSALWDLYKTKCITGVHANTAGSSSVYTGKPIMFVPGNNMSISITNATNYVRVLLDSYGSCLIEGTKIKMIDGSEKNVEDIEPGESIMSYDPNTGTNVEAIVVSNSCTGTADDYTNYYFDDGNFVTIYGKHCLYNADEGTARGVDFWEIGWTGMNDKNEEITFIGSEDVTHAGRKKHYDIRSSNKLYYANGILTAQALTLDYSTLPDRDPELPQVFLDAIKADYDSSANLTKHKMNKEYGKRLAPILREMKAQQKKMDENKKRLADTDYIVSKFTEGLISAAEWIKSKTERANWRKLVNEAEDAYSLVKERYDTLKEEFKPQSTKRERFNAAVARDNACLDALKEYYKEKNSK